MSLIESSPLPPAIIPFFGDPLALGLGGGVPAPGLAPAAPACARGDMTLAELKAAMPHAGSKAGEFLAPLNTAFRNNGVDKPEQRAALLAHISVESKQLHGLVENLNYSAARLHAVWPGRFKTATAGAAYAHNPEALANHVYSGRLANGDEASGDGWRYRGRGLLQITGRYNYRKAGFENNPEALEIPSIAAETAARHWKERGLNERTAKVLTRSEFNATTVTVNGGHTGSNERWAAYRLALKALTPPAAASPPRR